MLVCRKDTFREHEVGGAVSAWSADDWEKKCAEFRDDEWSERSRCLALLPESKRGPESAIRTPAKELAWFRDTLKRRTDTAGLAYMHAAAGVLQQGILLLCSDHRLKDSPLTAVHDFGSRQYETSIILFFYVGQLRIRPVEEMAIMNQCTCERLVVMLRVRLRCLSEIMNCSAVSGLGLRRDRMLARWSICR